MIIQPKLGPPVRRVDTDRLGDYLYDRARSRQQLAQVTRDWEGYKQSLDEYSRYQIEQIEKIYGKINRKKVEKVS